jgi:tetraacyldisaccharide 4'-kinase
MSPDAWFNRMWYGRARAPWWLLPWAAMYGAASGARRYGYVHGWRQSALLTRPVIVIGNLTVGGTGKTPLVCWLCEQLVKRGAAPGIVTRGYGGAAATARLLQPGDDAAMVGDEPVLLYQRSHRPVAVGRDRPAAARLLIAAGCDVILSDDGLQHYALRRDCEIVVIDGERRFGNGSLLPAGPLRESTRRLATVNAVVVNGGPRHVQGANELRMDLLGVCALALNGGPAKPLAGFAGQTVHAVAAIGNPQRFFALLRATGIEVIEHALADHAALGRDDIYFPDDRPVLMTEKDAVKCTQIAGSQHWYVPVSANFETRDAETLLGIVLDAIGRRLARAKSDG